MFKELFFLIIILIIYFFVYIYFKINNNNEIYLFDSEPTKYNINKETYLKSPFYFNGTHLNDAIHKKELILIQKEDNYIKYKKNYEKIDLIEPYIKFFPESFVYYIKPKKYLNLHINYSQYNFYFIKKGICNITFIHPKYKDNFYKNNNLQNDKKKINYIKNNKNIFQSLEAYENTLIYIPNYWIIFIENINNKNTIIECINYNNIFDKLFHFNKKNLIKMNKIVL